jgi:hypothetical protein
MNEGHDERRIVPIACTLNAGEMPARLEEWKAFVRQSVVASETSPTSARFLLTSTDEALVAAASLAQREKECCAFFDFAILIEAQQRWLNVTVPSGAEETLASFAATLVAPPAVKAIDEPS